MKYKVVLFDADGVTINHSTMFSDELETDYGITKATTHDFFFGIFQQCMVGKADLKEELAKVVGLWGWKGTVDELVAYWFSKGDQFDQKILDLVSRLRTDGVHCFMATNQEKYRGEHLREALKGVFEDVLVSADLGHKKNEREYFDAAFERVRQFAGDDKGSVLFIDDDERNVLVAREFGIDAIIYRRFADMEERAEFSEMLSQKGHRETRT